MPARDGLRSLLAGAMTLAGLFVAAPVQAEAAAAYVVVVDYTVDAVHFPRLRQLVDAVARDSISEPGCRRFDVVEPAASPQHLTLYEVFDDAAAFAAHAATPHFKLFGTESAALGATRTATPGTLVLSLQKP